MATDGGVDITKQVLDRWRDDRVAKERCASAFQSRFPHQWMMPVGENPSHDYAKRMEHTLGSCVGR